MAERITDPAELALLQDTGPSPWPDGDHPVWIRIRPYRITGRGVSPTPAPAVGLTPQPGRAEQP